MSGASDKAQRIVQSRAFTNTIIAVIFLAVITAGIAGLPGLPARASVALEGLEGMILAVFAGEMALRIAAHGARPWRFFQNGWNVFDLVIVVACFLPVSRFVAVLRLVRVLRVLRLVAPLHESEVIRRKNVELACAYDALAAEQAKSERLLLNVLPVLIAQRLKNEPGIIADSFADATVLFADIVGYTAFSAGLPPTQVVSLLDEIFSRFDQLAGEFGLEKIKTIGDAYMVVAGVPEPRTDHAKAAAGMALEMQRSLAGFNRDTGRSLMMRIGLNCGPVVAGVIGRKKFIFDLWGDTVNIASRMESHSLPGCIQITEALRSRLGDGFVFEERGVMEIKSKGPMRTYFLKGVK
jgi:class 3 adenylate cyclase